MKKARNFWRDLPQGGSRYGSVLTRLFLLLCLLATTQAGWAQTGLVNIDFKSWTTNSSISGNGTPETIDGVTFKSRTDKPFSVTNGIGLTFCNNNLESSNSFFAIPLTGINGSITITIKPKTYSGNKASVKYVLVNQTTVSTPGASGTRIQASSNGGDIVATVNYTNTNAVLYIGRYNDDDFNQTLESIVVTTPIAYDVTLDNDNSTTTRVVSANADAAMPTKLKNGNSLSKPSMNNYTFGGYYDDHAGEGTQYYTNNCTSAHIWDKNSTATLYAKWTQTVTLDANTSNNGSGSNQSATAIYKGSALTGFTATTPASNYSLNGFYTSATGGTKVLNADGSFAASDVTDYITNGKWTRTGSAPTLYAQYVEGSSSTPVDLTDQQFAWSAASSTATIGGSNTFPTLTNEVPVDVTYESSNTDAATIESDGTITLNAAGTTTISAIFAGSSSYNAKTVTYTLTVNGAASTSGTATFDYSASGANASSWTQSPITVATNSTGIDGSKHYLKTGNSNADDLELTISGANITKVVVHYQSTSYLPTTITANDGTDVTTTGTTSTWVNATGTNELILTLQGNKRRVTKIDVTYGEATTPTFTTSPANNASGVAVDAAVTMTANNGTISMVSSTIAGTLKEGDATAAAATFTLNDNVLTLTHSNNFKNNTTYEVTLNANQVSNTIGNNTLTTFSFTTASPVLTVSNATGSSISVAGGAVTLTKGVTGNSGEGTWTFASSNTDVATVTDAGVVTPKAAGTTTITATYTLDGQNYTKTYNMTVTAASASSTKWDFTTLTEDEITSMSENSKSLNEDTSNKFFKNKSWAASGSQFYGGSNGDEPLNVCEGIVFDKSGNSISNGNIRFYYTEGNTRIFLANGYRMKLPATVTKDSKVRVTWSSNSSSSASLLPTNATYSGSGSATSNSTTPITSEFTVTAASPAFAAQNAAIYIYKVELGDSYDVIEPTLTPAEDEFTSSSDLSVTINSTQTDGTVTHYYGFGTEKKTKEQLVSENKTVTSNSSVTPESGIENNLVLSVVTKVVKGGNTYYSDVVTGNYTYTGPRTGSLKLTDLHIQQGQRGLIFPSIVDASGNTILFGEDDASSVDLSKYFTFSYSKQSGGTSDENITVNLAEDKLNGDVYTKKDGNLAPVGATAVIKVTATPKDAAHTYVPNQAIEGTVNVTVIAKVQGLDWATLWWDKEMTDNQITVENGDYTVDDNESSTTKNYGIFTGTPNGRVIYVKPDVSKCDSICYFLQTKTDTKPTVSISYITMSSGNYHHYRHGIPIYIKDLKDSDTDANKTLWLSILGFKKTIVDGKETWIDAGSVMNMKFTLTAHALASNPVYAEETSVRQNTNRGTTVYTSDDGSTRNNTDINELYGKWSSKDNYTVTQMMTMPGTYVTYGVGSISVYSTEIGNRKLSAVQVAQTKENNEIFYYVSAVDNSHTYKFDIGTNLKFSQTDYTVNVTGTTGSNVDFTEPTVTGTYYDKGNKVTKEISYVTSGPTTTTSNLTYELIGAPTGVSIDASTGELTIDNGTITSQFRVKATYIGGQAIEEREGEESTSEPYTINGKGPGYTAPSSTEYTVNIVNPIEHVPSIQPATCNFSNTINVSISTPMSENGESYGVYYTIDGTDPTDGNGNYHGTYIKPDQNDVVTLGADLEIDETVTVKAVAVGTPTTYESRIVSETYTKKKEVARPTFSPDGTSEPYYYYSSDKSLKVNISASDGATIYYTIGNPNVELISENLYEGLEGAVINGSGSIYAVAVKDGVRSSVAKSDYVYTTSIAAPVFVVEGNNYPTASTTSIEVTPETNIGLTAAQGNIYYTLDGSTPSENNGILYTGPFTTFHTITARAIAVDGEASSRVTTMTFTVPYDAEENDFWEAVEETTPGGVLAADKRVISMANNSPRAVKYLTAVFGGGLNEIYGNEPWSDRPINEASVGMPIDGVGTYSIRIDTEAKDELNVLYNHANAKGEGGLSEKAPRSAKIPVQGNIVRFEPERTGDLTIWALQEGALNYSNGKFCNAILSCRPVYLVDEQGQSIQPTLATSNSRLSANWDLLVSKENLLDKGQSQNGLTNNAYTQAQEQAIYDMFIDMLNGKGAGDNITNLKYIHNSEKQWNITDNVNDNTGYAIPSTGYVKYTFPVKANKTYYFFSPRGKIGIRGFRFVPESTEPTTLTITEAGPNADNIIAAKGQTRKTSGFDRAYPANWTALTLPFSLSESQVRSIFGDEVSVLLFDRIEGTTIYLKRHYNQGIIAGVPVIIKGSTAVDKATSLNNLHVYVEETTAQNTTSEGYTYEGNFDPVDVNKYDYYMNSTGGISRWTNNATTTKPIKSLRAVIRNINHSSAKLNMFMSTFMEEDENNVLTGIQVIYDEVTGDINVIDNANIYNINGQLVRKNAKSLEGLPKGIYIVNGKKVAVK